MLLTRQPKRKLVKLKFNRRVELVREIKSTRKENCFFLCEKGTKQNVQKNKKRQ